CNCGPRASLSRSAAARFPLAQTKTKSLNHRAAVLNVKHFHEVELFPAQAVADHHVEDAQQLAHAGNDLHLFQLPALRQMPREAANDRVESHGGDGGHVQHAAHRRSTAADGAFAFDASRVVV